MTDRGPGIKRNYELRCGEEGYWTDEQFAFVMAIEKWKREQMRVPSYTNLLAIAKGLGYHRDDVKPPMPADLVPQEPVEAHRQTQRDRRRRDKKR